MSEYIIGIDEAGRGPLAGRVFVGAVLLPLNYEQILKNTPGKIADSKALSEKKRNEWFGWIKESEIKFSYSSVSWKRIDKININRATDIAGRRAIKKIKLSKNSKIKIISDKGFFLTGNLLNRFEYKKVLHADIVIPAVSLASIVAKVMRDKEMVLMSKKYPQYGFEKNKGYGTLTHRLAIEKFGPCKIHRLTFIKQ